MVSLNEPNVQRRQHARRLSLGKAEVYPDTLMPC